MRATAPLPLLLSGLLLAPVLRGCAALEAPPRFTVDLDKPPARRWDGAVDAVLRRHPFGAGFGPAFQAHNDTLFSHLSAAQWATVGAALRDRWPEQAAEVRSIAAQMSAAGHPVSYEYLAGWVYFHELGHSDLMTPAGRESAQLSCSGLVAESARGEVWHTAHMDQAPDSVRNVTLRLTFTRGGEVVMEGVDWYWFTAGVTRVVRKGVASAQENWRTTGTLPAADVLRDIAAGAVPHVYAFRAVLAPERGPAAATFADAVRAWTTQPFAAPEYIVASGPAPGDGVVIARGLNTTDNPPSGVLRLRDTPDGWYLAQSNYDHWEEDPKVDPRRSAAEYLFRELGRDEAATPLGMYAIANTWPIHNPKTVYTAVMNVATGELHAYVRRAMCPERRDVGWPFVSGFANGVHYKCNLTGQ